MPLRKREERGAGRGSGREWKEEERKCREERREARQRREKRDPRKDRWQVPWPWAADPPWCLPGSQHRTLPPVHRYPTFGGEGMEVMQSGGEQMDAMRLVGSGPMGHRF